MYSIKLSQIAVEALKAIDVKTRNQILSKIEQLKEQPLLLGKALIGPLKEFRSVRAAGQRYRIIFKVVESQIIVIVVAVGIRKAGDKKDIYELMKKYVRVGILGKDG